MLHKYSIDECIEQCNKFDAENGVDDYNESILYYLQKYRDIKNSGGNGGYASPASQAVLPSGNPLTVEDLKCCGNCYYFDIIDNKGGVCDKDKNQMPCTKSAVCEDWKFDAEK